MTLSLRATRLGAIVASAGLSCLSSCGDTHAAEPKAAEMVAAPFTGSLVGELYRVAIVAKRTPRPKGVSAYRFAQNHSYFTVDLRTRDALLSDRRGNLQIAHASALPAGIVLFYEWEHPSKSRARHEHALVTWRDIMRRRRLCRDHRRPHKPSCSAHERWLPKGLKKIATGSSPWVRTDRMRHTPRLAGGSLYTLGERLVYQGRHGTGWSLFLPMGHALLEVSPIRPDLLLLTTNSYTGRHDGELTFPLEDTQVFLVRVPSRDKPGVPR